MQNLKNKYFLLLLVLVPGILSAKLYKTPLDTIDLNGQVKSFKHLFYTIPKNSEIENKIHIEDYECFYNLENDIISCHYNRKQYGFDLYYKYEYDNENLIKFESDEKNNKEIYLIKYTYDNDKLIEKSSFYGSYKFKIILFYRFFTNMFNSNKDRKYLKLNILNKTTYSYDINGNLIKEIIYNKFNNISEINEYTYFNSNNIIESKKNDENGKLLVSCIFKYNQDRLKNEIIINRGSIKNKYSYYYDDKGNLIKEISQDLNNNTQTKIEFKYDKHNNQTEKIFYDEKGNVYKLETNEYEYDSKNNWMKKISFINGKAETFEEREITYYD